MNQAHRSTAAIAETSAGDLLCAEDGPTRVAKIVSSAMAKNNHSHRKRPMMKSLVPLFAVLLSFSLHAQAERPLVDMREMLDVGTLDVKVLQDWRLVKDEVPTRQKLITIRVGDLLPGREYRVPVRMIVPARGKATGFHLTGGHDPPQLEKAVPPRGVEQELIRGGVGLVYTVVQVLERSGQGKLGQASNKRFIETLNPRYSIQYWGWPATLMRAVTAAYAEKEHFKVGKVALSGGSKNGASPSVAIIHDERMTAVHAGVSPIWDSPLRLCDRKVWDDLHAANKRYAGKLRGGNPRVNQNRIMNHQFLGGTFGPVYNNQALDAGHTWEDLRKLADVMADRVFVSRYIGDLKAREVDMYFHPGTHDFVAFDVAWGGRHHPQIPLYLRANSGHGKKTGHPAAERDEQNKSAFLLEHFFDNVEPLLESPSVKSRLKGNRLSVAVTFKPGSKAESGRIWWMYNRGPDGSAAYINDMIPENQWKDMQFDADKNAWTVSIDLKLNASRIDFFSNHRKTITYRAKKYPTYISSPYTRVSLKE